MDEEEDLICNGSREGLIELDALDLPDMPILPDVPDERETGTPRCRQVLGLEKVVPMITEKLDKQREQTPEKQICSTDLEKAACTKEDDDITQDEDSELLTPQVKIFVLILSLH